MAIKYSVYSKVTRNKDQIVRAATTTERNAIPASSRKIGMIVMTDDGNMYQLVSGIADGNWTTYKVQNAVAATTATTATSATNASNATTWNGANKTVSTSDPSGGVDGDIWFKVV